MQFLALRQKLRHERLSLARVTIAIVISVAYIQVTESALSNNSPMRVALGIGATAEISSGCGVDVELDSLWKADTAGITGIGIDTTGIGIDTTEIGIGTTGIEIDTTGIDVNP